MAYMEPWVRKCTEGRIKASKDGNLIKKSFYKLVNTLIYFLCFFITTLITITLTTIS